MKTVINHQELKNLEDDGFLQIKNFLSESELSPLINELVNLALAFGATKKNISKLGNIDEVFVDIINKNKALQPFLYDRLQLLPQLLKIPSLEKVQKLSQAILQTENVGVWPRMQLRLDLANDSQNLIEWHTDYIYNKGTFHSYTFWLPIVQISKEMGPILMVPGSHKKSYKFIKSNIDRRHPFTLEVKEASKLKTMQLDQFQAGDLIVFHSKFLHSGMVNKIENRARLVCVFRMQNVNKLDIFSGDNDD
jgi:uncharacterized protein YkvS